MRIATKLGIVALLGALGVGLAEPLLILAVVIEALEVVVRVLAIILVRTRDVL